MTIMTDKRPVQCHQLNKTNRILTDNEDISRQGVHSTPNGRMARGKSPRHWLDLTLYNFYNNFLETLQSLFCITKVKYFLRSSSFSYLLVSSYILGGTTLTICVRNRQAWWFHTFFTNFSKCATLSFQSHQNINHHIFHYRYNTTVH